jgi:predicted HicB family RNase H-like nuclease
MPSKKAIRRGRPPKPKGEALGDPTPIRFPDDERAHYERLAKREGVSLSEWVRQTLKQAVEK